MRYSADHKQRTHERLLAAAAEQMRLHGPDGISVADLMKRLGLTHGGFYAHFKSKDDLIAAAITAMFEQAAAQRAKALAPSPTLDAFIDIYLSPLHRDHPARGCPVPSLMSESRRWARAARKAFDRGLGRFADHLSQLMPPQVENPHDAALSLIAQMAGVVALARAISDPDMSKAVLDSSREALKLRFMAGSAGTEM